MMSITNKFLAPSLWLVCGLVFSHATAQVVNFEQTWKEFLSNEKTSNISKLPDPGKEQTEDYLKYQLMYANSHFCANEMPACATKMGEIKRMGVAKYDKIPHFKDKYDALLSRIEASTKLEGLWKRYVIKKNVTVEEIDGIAEVRKVCNKSILAKLSLMETNAYLCKGDIAKSKEVFEKRVLQISEKTDFKPKSVPGMPEEIQQFKNIFAGLDKLNPMWDKFISSGTSTGCNIDLPVIACYPIPNIKIYTLKAYEDICKYGPEMYKKIKALQTSNPHELPADLNEKVTFLSGEVGNTEEDMANLNLAWKEYTPKDTLLKPIADYKLVPYYCDKIAQVKSWVMKGGVNSCAEGQQYLDSINALQKRHNLVFDAQLACHVLRLRIEVWDCRYWEIVAQARKETHEERERFGPASALIMQTDLNGKGVVCPTTVKYEPLGYIGIKYQIVINLCQNLDVANMGDPEYYKKIAAWLNNQVLVKYCNTTNWRCKEGFAIYLEGHTDGNNFTGAKYDRALNIPIGTPYTHFMSIAATKTAPARVDTLKKTNARLIMNDLKNNMELGMARAWSVKQQLDFMSVPITIGAFEHAKHEKTANFRHIDIYLNIPNLLLDFYEKRLKELLLASGIGERPKPC